MSTSRKKAPREAPSRRSYTSPLRAAQRDATRREILEAARSLIETSPDALTVAAIATRAGVSVPTVNRHFPTRQALFEGVVEHLDATALGGPSVMPDPTALFTSRLGAVVGATFTRFAALPAISNASAAVLELRSRVTVPRRRRLADEGIAQRLPTLAEPHRTWLADLLVVLVSSSMVHTVQSYLGLPPEEGAKRVAWLLEALLAAAQAQAQTQTQTQAQAAGREGEGHDPLPRQPPHDEAPRPRGAARATKAKRKENTR